MSAAAPATSGPNRTVPAPSGASSVAGHPSPQLFPATAPPPGGSSTGSSAGPPAGAPPAHGLVRPRRRVVNGAQSAAAPTTAVVVKRSYNVAGEVGFVNFRELKNDSLSPEYSQQILEEAFLACGLDFSNDKAMRMAEDVVFTHLIENAASAKTSYETVVDVYGKELDLMVLLRVLVSHEQTPRRFARGLADRIYEFMRLPDNEALRVDVAAKHSLEDPAHAVVAFDGATHITNLPTNLRTVANVLASRGIYDTMASAKTSSELTTYDSLARSTTVGNTVSGMARQ